MKINSWPVALLICGLVFFTSACSDDENPAPTCSTPTGLASTPTDVSAAVSWTAVSGAANYSVDYKLSTASTWTVVTASTTSTSANITGLTASSTYDWRVRTNCSGGNSSYATAQFTTGSGGACGVPTGLSTSSVSSSGATLNWTAVTGAATYDVEYKLTTAGTWTAFNQAGTSKALTGLAASTTYDWRVRTNCTVGGTSAYATGQFTTGTGTTTQNISISGNAYNPSPVTVAVGTSVTWTNNDGVQHTSTSDDGTTFNTGTINAGATSAPIIMNTMGTFTYHCNFHGGMSGTIIVN
jgi:plastocyanin